VGKIVVWWFLLRAACCPKRDFYTHTPPRAHPPKNGNRLLYCILKIARLLYCILKKAAKKAARKVGKSLFLNLSCCCLETGLVCDMKLSHLIAL